MPGLSGFSTVQPWKTPCAKSGVASLWADVLVRQALMIALSIVVGDEILNSCPQRLLAEDHDALQPGFLDASYKSLCIGVQVG